MFELIAFDADDTLWHTEKFYITAQDKLKQMLANYHSPEWIDDKLYQVEMSNLEHFGYGIKAFTLSMIETAVELTEGRIQGREIQQIVEFGKEMLRAEVRLLEYVKETIAHLSPSYDLMILTKGDLLDQETKISRSGLVDHFKYVEVMSDKTKDRYQTILDRYGIDPARFVMVGNSLRSDILPVLELGGTAVYIPYPLTWTHESTPGYEVDSNKYHELEHIGQLPALIETLQGEKEEH